jgi:hypothetical protein
MAAVVVASVCSACVTPNDGNPYNNPPAIQNRPPSSVPTADPPTASPPTASVPTASGNAEQETLAFGKSHSWDDGVTLTVGKPKKFQPSEYTALNETQRYVKFTITVVNKSDKPLDLGLTYISAESSNEEAHQVFDSGTGLRGPPDSKLPKGQTSTFDVGFGVADTTDVVMEIELHDDLGRPSVRYST